MILLSPIDEINVLDIILEGSSLLAYVFIFFMAIYANKKNKIFASKGFPILIIALILGITAVFMNFLDELLWFDNYEIYKTFMIIFQIASLIIFGLALIVMFKFQKFMMGEDLN